ncbi:HlyD family secretion protein [Massilia yuzhufengensis]|uniref:HlyD family secretion protein n=1 Tax=Massilia yuzhufengensis TaxID=1164594 RepID=A0A1I1R389_9BURK|nr:HlyD family efflux transporter periplasmic adaptor subunit [Massilia yuzhufengensis]SFD28759.1 HlyD family secretion protein [Massilia yuzhufengensis]
MIAWRGWRLGALLLLAALLALGATAGLWWQGRGQGQDPGPGFVGGNGRIEATEIDIATRLPGRVAEVLVQEGDMVKAGQVLARMDPHTLLAQRAESAARERQARDAVAQAAAGLAMRRGDEAAAAANVVQRLSELEAAQRRLRRSTTLAAAGAVPSQELDDDEARVRGAEAAVTAARAQREAAAAAIEAARAQVVEARSSVAVALAATARIDADLRELELRAPRAGRVQYRVAQPGEVLPGGGTVLNLIDLSDVFMSFFVPEAAAGRVALGAEVRLRLDAAPGFIVPARVTYVASSAQFTPKSVETASERQKLMFRVKAQVDRQVLLRYADHVKAGVPGVAWVRLDRRANWPPALALRGGQ